MPTYWDDDSHQWIAVETIDFTSPKRTHHLVAPEGWSQHQYGPAWLDELGTGARGTTARERGEQPKKRHHVHPKVPCPTCSRLMLATSKGCRGCRADGWLAERIARRETCACGNPKMSGRASRCAQCRSDHHNASHRKGKAA